MSTPRSSNRNIDYRCTLCQREVGRESLIVKRVQFVDMNGKTIRTRVVGWLCTVPNGDEPSCADKDPVSSMPLRVTTPGMKDTRIAQGEALASTG